MGVSEIVQNTIASSKVVMFSKTTCPFCVKAKNLFDDLGQAFVTLELDEIRIL
jgi:glutaredoxin 3